MVNCVAYDSPTIHPPFTHHSPTIHLPFTYHSPTIHPPFTYHSPTIHPPFTYHSPTIHLPFTHHSTTIHPPFTHHSPIIHLPFTYHFHIICWWHACEATQTGSVLVYFWHWSRDSLLSEVEGQSLCQSHCVSRGHELYCSTSIKY